jgi:four helix bundle protein
LALGFPGLVDAESEAAETQVWLEFAVKCEYLPREQAASLYQTYHGVIGTLVGMRTHPETWVIGEEGEG